MKLDVKICREEERWRKMVSVDFSKGKVIAREVSKEEKLGWVEMSEKKISWVLNWNIDS